MSQVFAFMLELVRYAVEHDISLPKVGAYDDVSSVHNGRTYFVVIMLAIG